MQLKGTFMDNVLLFCRCISSLACFNVQNISDDGIVLGTELLVDPLDVLDGDLLDGGDDVVLGAEVNALLGLHHPTDQGARDAQLVEHQGRLHHLMAKSKSVNLESFQGGEETVGTDFSQPRL